MMGWVVLENLVTGLWNISVQATVIFCVLLLAREFFRLCRIPKKYACFLWMILFVRLLMPIQPESPVGLWIKGSMPLSPVENMQPVGGGNGFAPGEAQGIENENISTEIQGIGNENAPTDPQGIGNENVPTDPQGIGNENAPTDPQGIGNESAPTGFHGIGNGSVPAGSHWRILSLVWGAGCLGFLLYGRVSCLLLKKRLRCSIRQEDSCYLVDGIPTAFVMGAFPPRIYVPSELEGEDLAYVILHERMHIKRMDHLVKITAYLITCVYWFHPLVWAALVLMGKDIELSCDEAVLGKLGENSRREYADTLLRLSDGKRYFEGVPLAFGEGDTESRIRHIAKYRKPVAAAAAIAVILLSGLAVILLTGRPGEEPEAPLAEGERGERNGGSASSSEAPAREDGENNKSIGQDSFDSINSRFPEPVELPSGHIVAVTGDVYHISIAIDGDTYRMADLCGIVNALMEIREFDKYIVVDGHISPNTSYYGFYSTESKQWEVELTGSCLTWDENWETLDNPIESVVYAESVGGQGVLYDWLGNRIAVFDLEEEYLYGLKREGDDITITIVDYAGESREKTIRSVS